MDEDKLNELLGSTEDEWLDWKGDFPPKLATRAKDQKGYEDARGEVLKDLSALANARGRDTAFLVFGVVDNGPERFVKGVEQVWNDATFQTWNRTVFDPPIVFTFVPLVLGVASQ